MGYAKGNNLWAEHKIRSLLKMEEGDKLVVKCDSLEDRASKLFKLSGQRKRMEKIAPHLFEEMGFVELRKSKEDNSIIMVLIG